MVNSSLRQLLLHNIIEYVLVGANKCVSRELSAFNNTPFPLQKLLLMSLDLVLDCGSGISKQTHKVQG